MALEDKYQAETESANNSSTNYISIEERLRNKLESAVRTENDAIISQAWVIQCEQYPSLQKYLPRVQEAKRRIAALEQFRSALATNDDETIVRSFDPVLNGYPPIRSQEWQRLSEAVMIFFSSCTFGQESNERWKQTTLLRRFIDACRANDDAGIISAFQAIKKAGYLIHFGLSNEESDRVERAKRRIGTYQQFREALRSSKLRLIYAAYLDVLHYDVELQQEEQEQAELALRFIATFDVHKKDDEALVTAEEDRELLSIIEEIERSRYKKNFQFTGEELERVNVAQKRVTDLQNVRTALDSGRPQEIVRTYEAAPLLNENHLTMEERTRLGLAKRYIEATRTHGNQVAHPAVIEIFHEIAASPYSGQFLFTLQETPAALGKTMVDFQQPRLTSEEEQQIIVHVEGTPVYHKLFQQVYRVKQQYIWLRQSQLQAMPGKLSDLRKWIHSQRGVTNELYSLSEAEKRKIAQQVLDDILDGFSTKKEIDSLSREDKRKVEQRLQVLFEEFTQREGFQYQHFLQTNELTDDDIRKVLAIYARREFLTEDLVKRKRYSIDIWLEDQRQLLKIEDPAQEQPVEQKGGGSWKLKSLLRVIDWFGKDEAK